MDRKNEGRSTLVIGTRGSRLALWQAEWIRSRLQELVPDLSITLKQIRTSGDKILDVPLAKIGGKGLFVKEIEEALLVKEIDLAVHSMKDVPSVLPDGLAIICVSEREDSRDALLSREGYPLERLKEGAKIGTSSLRRQAQLLHYRPDFSIHTLRGNLDTRIRKLETGQYDAIVLAAAGLKRLGWADEVTAYLSPEISLPAIGQGVLAIEGREDDRFVCDLVGRLEHSVTRLAVTAERAFLARLEGGCQVPIAGYATIHDHKLELNGLVASVDGQRVIRDKVEGSSSQAAQFGLQLAEKILGSGGDAILQEVYGTA